MRSLQLWVCSNSWVMLATALVRLAAMNTRNSGVGFEVLLV